MTIRSHGQPAARTRFDATQRNPGTRMTGDDR